MNPINADIGEAAAHDALIERLKKAAKPHLSAEERRAQAVSFAMSAKDAGDPDARKRMEEAYDRHFGLTEAK